MIAEKLKYLNLKDISEQNIDIINKTIVLNNENINLNDLVLALKQANSLYVLAKLRVELTLKLRLYGFTGYDIYKYLESIGYDDEVIMRLNSLN